MATTPFGESFGDPRRYMGQSPLAQVGQALKTGAVLYGLHKSGAIEALDKMGIKSDNKGGFTFNKPAGSVPPAGAVVPTAPSATEINMFNSGANPAVPPEMQTAPVMPTQPMGVQVTPMGQEAPSNVQINTFAPPPPDAGMQLMNNTYRPQSSVDVKNDTDFNPLAPDYSNQFAVSGNDYQQVPGYGKLQRIAGQFMGMG
jgi:hypothetical protein